MSFLLEMSSKRKSGELDEEAAEVIKKRRAELEALQPPTLGDAFPQPERKEDHILHVLDEKVRRKDEKELLEAEFEMENQQRLDAEANRPCPYCWKRKKIMADKERAEKEFEDADLPRANLNCDRCQAFFDQAYEPGKCVSILETIISLESEVMRTYKTYEFVIMAYKEAARLNLEQLDEEDPLNDEFKKLDDCSAMKWGLFYEQTLKQVEELDQISEGEWEGSIYRVSNPVNLSHDHPSL